MILGNMARLTLQNIRYVFLTVVFPCPESFHSCFSASNKVIQYLLSGYFKQDFFLSSSRFCSIFSIELEIAEATEPRRQVTEHKMLREVHVPKYQKRKTIFFFYYRFCCFSYGLVSFQTIVFISVKKLVFFKLL